MVKRDLEAVSMGSRGFKSKSAKTDMDNGAIPANISTVSKTDTVIIGNGPSALALSYLLHGNEPWYTPSEPHPDSVLHRKLLKKAGLSPSSEGESDIRLYDVLQTPKDYDDLTCHFPASVSMSYSTAALPLNTLLDTLLRPLADVDLEESVSRVGWKKTSDFVPHVILGEEPKAGGQWAGDEVWFGDEDDEESDNGLKTLSYADLLSLPGYSLGDHYKQKYHKEMDTYYRPTRRLVAEYYATYPRKVGIEDVLFPGTSVTNVERINDKSGFNFLVSIKLKTGSGSASHDAHVIRCRNVVLGTGIFSHRLPPPPVYAPFIESKLETPNMFQNNPRDSGMAETDEKSARLPLLVVGSGYTAADAILCNKGKRPVVHVYRWDPEGRPSPLRGCHPQAYPGYAGVYRQMKDAALKKQPAINGTYQGYPNAIVTETRANGTVKLSIRSEDGTNQDIVIEVADIEVCIGRRGRLDYLAPTLCKEIGIKNLDYSSMGSANNTREPQGTLTLARTATSSKRYSTRSRKPMLHPTTSDTAGKVWVRYSSLRERVEQNIEVTPNVFIIGSLTGDSLVRFAMGGCVYSAGRILSNTSLIVDSSDSSTAASETSSTSESEGPPKSFDGKARRRRSRCAVV